MGASHLGSGGSLRGRRQRISHLACPRTIQGPRAPAKAGVVTPGVMVEKAGGTTPVSRTMAGDTTLAGCGTVRGIKALRCQDFPSPAGRRLWLRAQLSRLSRLRSREDSAVASSWVQAVLNRVMGGTSTSVAPPSVNPAPIPAIAAAPLTAVATERSGQDDSGVCCTKSP